MIIARFHSARFSVVFFMGSEKDLALEEKIKDTNKLKIIEWEDFEQEIARLWSLSSALKQAKENKTSLENKLESLIQVRAESLNRSNELEEMRQKLEERKLEMGNMSMRSKVVAGDVRYQEGKLSIAVRSLLVAGKSISAASKQLQEANLLLAGEKGHRTHLTNVQKMLRVRQQYMFAQVSALYPVKTSAGTAPREMLNLSPDSSRSEPAGSRPSNSESLTVSGLQLTTLPLKKIGFFSDKKEVQRSATALGYIAHAASLVASYLDVPLRYPLRLGGSHSYVIDYAPSVEPTSSDATSSTSIISTNSKPTEFPLFLEGQDTTRAAYAIFLLNKDLEQLLNFIGVKSLGPRHVLANLKELFKTIQSPECIDK